MWREPHLTQRIRAICLLLLLCCWTTSAAALTYQVELDAPADVKPMLTQYLDIYRWHDNPALDEAQLHRLYRLTPASIQELLATAGYFSPTITPSIQQQDGTWYVRFRVAPGEPTTVSKTTIRAQGSITDDTTLYQEWLNTQYAQWPLQNGIVFRQDIWESAKRNLLTSLLITKYPQAKIISSTAVVNPDSHSVSIEIELDSGLAYHFGATTIHGLQRYPASLIERLNPITPGAPYSQAKLLEFQSKLQGRPYFKSVSVMTVPDKTDPTILQVAVNVVELQKQKVGFGLGYSTDSGPRGQLEYQNLDALNTNLRFSSTFKMDTLTRALTTQVEQPIDQSGYINSVNVSTKRTDIAGEISSQSAAAVKRTRTKSRIETSIIAQYQIEHKSLSGAQGDNLQALTLNYIWTYRNVDSLITPNNGYIFSTEFGGAAQALLSDQDFIRSRSRAIYYYPISPFDNLTVRGELGVVSATSTHGIPSDMLFRTGGDTTIRGYNYQSLGVQQGTAIVGGRYLVVGSVEYTHWLTSRWGAALFYDRGNAADSLRDFKTVAGYGVGARWRSPIGLLNLDIGYGEAISTYHIHFSLGSAF